ncbi:hypothetical protein D8M04_05935 [Oceanobacillus piezotolerans]|uniref:Uncharacterized protein n=1 Tax=Oceanobacillus piezotolerans TaxID=2448030 RepID=A0A498DJT9_9BACI|nr:hypothetical protein [Oceanobacillus piezotolerans]RLL46742.1 hypothetical protein D8M04_05935 [Oceanobacillus piezotolerans]
MSRMYTDFSNETIITIPDSFIEVKTGENQVVSPKTQEQIKFHAENNTLLHLIFSALESYLHPKPVKHAQSSDIMLELLEIKKMIKQGSSIKNHSINDISPKKETSDSGELNLKDIEDLLESFGG